MRNSNPMARRGFLRSTALISSGIIGMSMMPSVSHGAELPADERDNVIGPREGFAPQIGTLLSMMTWMRRIVLSPVMDLTVEQLDYVHDKNSNSIGSMLFHLAATERYYQIHTFEGKKWGDWNEQDKRRFDIAMSLGEEARKTIKGNSLDLFKYFESSEREYYQ
jgi:hypothetical protein